MPKYHYSPMITILLLLIIALTALSGCQPPHSEPTPTFPSSTSATIPSETTEPPVTEPSILSWEIPDYPQMRYEEYFSTVRIYGYTPIDENPKTYYYSFAWANGGDSCELWFHNGMLLAGNSLTNKYVQVGTEIYDDNDLIVACNEEWIFLVLDGTDLIRMDYNGENKETLFVDESGKISEHELSGSAYIRDGCVLFFMAGAGDGYGIYRLYLADMTLDLLVTSGESIWLLDPYSNHEVAWYIRNPEFKELYQSILNDPPPPYDEMIANNEPQIALKISYDYHIPMELDYYYNTLTCETKQREVFGERSDWTARAWWLEE